MIWKNPFLIKSTEKIAKESDFLRLFSSNSIRFLTEDKFTKVQFIRSSPGAGKTTVFKAFTSNVLIQLNNMKDAEMLRDFYQIVSEFRLIEDNQVKLLSCIIPCVKNYDLIDQIFQNGRRQQVLFGLLSIRITILLLKSILTIKSLPNTKSLDRISFRKFPDEFGGLEGSIHNGYDLLQWAYEEEKKICEYIDGLSDEKINFSLYYNTFFLLSFFEPNNILFDGEIFINHTLIMFDDAQKLTDNQRHLVINSFYTMRLQMGIWIGERFDALSAKEIVTSDGSVGREFEIIELEDYWRSRGSDSLYRKMLINIADRRVSMSQNDNISNFINCIENNINLEKYRYILSKANLNIEATIINDQLIGGWFSDVIEHIKSNNEGTAKNSIKWHLLYIIYKRESRGQVRFDMGKYQISAFEQFCQDSNNKNAAEYYMCINNNLPFYYGIDRLKEISSYNIGQFLSFSGAIFEKVTARKIISTGRKLEGPISAEDQEKYIKETSEQMWNDIKQKYLYGDAIQRCLLNLCYIAQRTRDSGTNPYTGGAITGVAIAVSELDKLKTQDEYSTLLKILGSCISSNYFEKSLIEHGGKSWLRLYFNRWLCVKFQLPLKYGGWRKLSIDKLNVLAKNDLSMDLKGNNQISLFDPDNLEVVCDE